MQDIIAKLTAKDVKYACAIADKIISESQKADLSKYKDSMRPLIERDMTETKKALIK